MNNRQIIIAPIITEKSMKGAEVGRYSFLVACSASKTAIKQAVINMFKVNVVNIRTSIIKGRQKRVGTRRIEVTESQWKKAIVQLKKGEKIGIFEPGGGEEEEKKKGK
jgi:large subunit ribosomal protein L23